MSKTELADSFKRVPEFQQCLSEDWNIIYKHLLAQGYLLEEGYMVQLGIAGETRFHGKRLADLCVSFDSPRTFAAMLGNKHLGNIDPSMLKATNDGPSVIALGGRSWRVVSIDWSREFVYVEKAEERGRSRWIGESRGLSGLLAAEVRKVLEGEDAELQNVCTQRSIQRLQTLQEDLSYTLEQAPIKLTDGAYEWWTYAGLASNLLLSAKIKAAGGNCKSVDSYSIRLEIADEKLAQIGNWQGITESPIQPANLASFRLKFADLMPNSIQEDISMRRLTQKVLD